jgi:hypothetical protein
MIKIRTLATRLVLTAGLVSAVAATTAAPTAAYTYWNTGSVGAMTTPRIVGTTIDSMTGSVVFPSRTIWKSPSYRNYNQWVCVRYEVVYAAAGTASWQRWAIRRDCGWISGSQTAINFPAVQFQALTNPWMFAGNVTVTWQLSNGYNAGTKVLDYNQTGDYLCTNCWVASSYSLGAYLLM